MIIQLTYLPIGETMSKISIQVITQAKRVQLLVIIELARCAHSIQIKRCHAHVICMALSGSNSEEVKIHLEACAFYFRF